MVRITPVFLQHCKPQASLLQALVLHPVCEHRRLCKDVLRQGELQARDTALLQLVDLQAEWPGFKHVAHIPRSHCPSEHTVEHTAALHISPKPLSTALQGLSISEQAQHFTLAKPSPCCQKYLQAVRCKRQRVQPVLRDGVQLPIDRLQDEFHLCCTDLLYLHNIACALWLPCLHTPA